MIVIGKHQLEKTITDLAYKWYDENRDELIMEFITKHEDVDDPNIDFYKFVEKKVKTLFHPNLKVQYPK